MSENSRKINRVRVLTKHRAYDLVLHKRLDAVERGLNSLLPFIDLHTLKPIPLCPNTRICYAPADGRANGAWTGGHQMLGLDERETRRNQGIGDVEQPPR